MADLYGSPGGDIHTGELEPGAFTLGGGFGRTVFDLEVDNDGSMESELFPLGNPTIRFAAFVL